jgi:hypothetical protein
LQKLQLDLEIVAFTDVSRLELCLTDVYGLLKAFEILQRKLQSRSREQYADELLSYIECQCAFGIANLSTCYRCLITSGLKTPLTLVTTFKEVSDPNIELLNIVQIIPGKILRTEERDELGICPESGIGTKVGGDLLGFVLEN